MIKIHSLMKKILLSFIPALLFFGCGVWGNFTTYFNLYYNASDLFEQAEKAIKEQKVDLFSTQELVLPGSANQQLVKVIEKASKILQYHNQTAFVDDALLMLGKSFFYQRNYQKALRKFNELVATYPESNLVLESELWIGKSEMKLKDYQSALQTLTNVRKKGIDEGEDEIVNQTFIEQIKYYISLEDIKKAIITSNELLGVSDDDELNAIVAYQLGKFYLDMEDVENAVAALEKVFDYSPTYETELSASIELGRALRKAGKLERSLAVLDDLRSEDKYKESYDILDVELGLTYKDLGEMDEAISNLQFADTAYANSLNSGVAKYELGLIFEKNYKNFDSAFYYYSRAAKAPSPSEYVIKTSEKFQLFTKYNTLQQNLSQFNKQLFYLQDSAAFIQDSIDWHLKDSIRQAEVTETLTNNEAGGDQQNAPRQLANNKNAGVNTQGQVKQQLPPQRPTFSEDSLQSLIAKNEFELGNLFFTEFDLTDSAYSYYSKVLDDFPNSIYHARTLYGLGSYYQIKGDKQKADSIFNYIYDNFKTESIVNAAANKLKKPLVDLNYDPAEALYASAEEKMLNKNLSESLTDFYNIYTTYPKSPIAPKALYASGFILENEMSMYDSAASVYDSITTKYPATVYAKNVQKKLTTYKQEQEKIRKAVLDSLKAMEQKRIDSLKTFEMNRIADSLKTDSLKTIKKKKADKLEPPKTIKTITDSTKLPINENELKNEKQDIGIDEKSKEPGDSLKIPDIPDTNGQKPESTIPDSLENGKIEEPGKI